MNTCSYFGLLVSTKNVQPVSDGISKQWSLDVCIQFFSHFLIFLLPNIHGQEIFGLYGSLTWHVWSCTFTDLLEVLWKIQCVCLEFLWIIVHTKTSNSTHNYALGKKLQPEGVGSLFHCFTSPKIIVSLQKQKTLWQLENISNIRNVLFLTFVCVNQVLWQLYLQPVMF